MEDSPYRDLPPIGYGANFHAHSTNSDGTGTPLQMGDAYVGGSITIYGLSDHDWGVNIPTVDPGAVGAARYIKTIEETCTDIASGHAHLICLDVNAENPSPNVQDVIDSVPYAYIPHPLDPLWGGWTLAEVEALAGCNALVIQEAGGTAFWDGLLTDGYLFYGVGDDDAHAVVEVKGRSWMVVYPPSLSVAAILEAFRQGQFYSTEGPVLSIQENGLQLNIQSTTFCNFFFYGRNGVQLWSAFNVKSVSYPYFGDEGYVRCYVVEVGTAKRAWTNPVWLA